MIILEGRETLCLRMPESSSVLPRRWRRRLSQESLWLLEKTEHTVEASGDGDVPWRQKNIKIWALLCLRAQGSCSCHGYEYRDGQDVDAVANAKEEETPLQIKLNQPKILTFMVIGICVLVFGVNIARKHDGWSE